MLKWIRRKVPVGETRMEDDSEDRGTSRGYPLRWNLLIIALLITGLNVGIIALTYVAMTQSEGNLFIIGALIGLLPTGITGLVGDWYHSAQRSEPIGTSHRLPCRYRDSRSGNVSVLLHQNAG